MSQISVSDSDKDWFDEWSGERTQSEAFADMVSIVRAYEGDPVDVEELAEELSHTLIPQTELASYRGCLEAMEGNDGQRE